MAVVPSNPAGLKGIAGILTGLGTVVLLFWDPDGSTDENLEVK